MMIFKVTFLLLLKKRIGICKKDKNGVIELLKGSCNKSSRDSFFRDKNNNEKTYYILRGNYKRDFSIEIMDILSVGETLSFSKVKKMDKFTRVWIDYVPSLNLTRLIKFFLKRKIFTQRSYKNGILFEIETRSLPSGRKIKLQKICPSR